MPGRVQRTPKRDPLVVRLGAAIRMRRESRNLTQERLAELSSLSKNYIGNIERGEYEVGLVALVHVARALGVRASEIVAEVGE